MKGSAADDRSWLRRHGLAVACASVLVGLLLASLSETFVEKIYARAISPALCRLLSSITGLLPFSVAELFVVGLTLAGVFLCARGAWRIARRPATWLATLRAGGARVLRLGLLIGAVFYLTWGVNYQRRPLAQRLSLVELARATDRAAQAQELEGLCRALVEATNAAYRQAHGCDDSGVPSTWPDSRAGLEASLDAGLDAAGYELGTEATFSGARGRSKSLLLSALMCHLRLSGFFFPWTGEANVNAAQPGWNMPQVIAHEKAHQRGIAREDEAEFLGYLACALSQHAYARYSASLFALEILRRDLRRFDVRRVESIETDLLPGVRRDEAANIAFWARYDGPVGRVATQVNHTYLITHGIAEGVANYSAVSKLLIAYARTRGSVVPQRAK